MPLNAGSTTVNSGTGVASGSGLSKAIFDARAARITFPAAALGAPGKQKLADDCNDIAAAIVAHITANAVVSISGNTSTAIPVTVVPATGIGATTAPGTVTLTNGTVA